MMDRGAELGPYRIVEPLGHGAGGSVYRALDSRSGAMVALKVLEHAPAQRIPEAQERFSREVEILSRLEHPNIVRATSAIEQHSGLYMFAMEFVSGLALDELMVRDGTLPVHRVLSISEQILSALEAAHGQGVVHRDIKPSNIVVADDGRVRLTDFGVAQWVSNSRLTREGVALGTPHYMSPEQCQGEAADERSDLYAVGALMYEMLEGRPPFHAENPLVIMKMQVEVPPPPMQRADIPAELREVVQRALEKLPKNRFANAAEMRQAIAELSRRLYGAVDRPTLAAPSLRRPKRWHRWVAAGAMVALLGAVLFVWPRPTHHLEAASPSTPPAPTVRIELTLQDGRVVDAVLFTLNPDVFDVATRDGSRKQIPRNDVKNFRIYR